jgi:hypothetical protein
MQLWQEFGGDFEIFRTIYRVRQRIGRILSVNKKLKNWISWYSYIYKEVRTLAFAEISESVVLKHNIEHKKKTQHIIRLDILHPQNAHHA